MTKYTREQLINALTAEYEFLCHDDFDPEVDPSPDEYHLMIQHLSDEELLNETNTDDVGFTLEEFITAWS